MNENISLLLLYTNNQWQRDGVKCTISMLLMHALNLCHKKRLKKENREKIEKRLLCVLEARKRKVLLKIFLEKKMLATFNKTFTAKARFQKFTF